MADSPNDLLRPVELGRLLSGVVRAVADAQDELDAHARARATAYVETPSGTLALPPLWHTLTDVAVDLEMSASVREAAAGPALACRLLNPQSVGLFGREAAAGLRVSLRLGPAQAVPVKPVP